MLNFEINIPYCSLTFAINFLKGAAFRGCKAIIRQIAYQYLFAAAPGVS